MIKNALAAIALLVVLTANAQENTASPYSFFALGDIKFKGSIENRTMGGISMYTDSIHLNLQNPASYGELKLTTYTAAVSYNHLRLRNEDTRENASALSLNYLSLGFPVSSRMGVGVGLLPYTSVGYRLESVDDSQPQTITNRYTGEGGVNRVYFSMGYAFTNELSMGITGNYNFGTLRNQILSVTEDVQLATRETNESNVTGADFAIALNYKKRLANQHIFQLLFMHSPQSKIQSENSREISTVSISLTGREIVEETENVDLQLLHLKNTRLTIPYSNTFGIGIGKEKKWFAAAEYTYKNMSVFSNPFIDIANETYKDAYQVSVGGFLIPKYDSFTNYWQRAVYRAGLRYEKTGLYLNDKAVNDFGISFGVGLPLGGFVPNTRSFAFAGMFSNINVGIDIGKRGTPQTGVQENYLTFNISLSLNDKWFIKRKYD